MSTTRSPHIVPAAFPSVAAPRPAPDAAPAGPQRRLRHRGAPVGGPDRPSPRAGRSTLAAVVVVTTVSLLGSLVAVASGLSDTWWDAVGSSARLSVPLPMNVAMLLLGLLAATRRRRTATVGAGLLAVACTLAVVSGFFDGGYAAELSPLERGVQVALVLSLAVTAVVAGRRVATVLRRS